MYEFLQPVMGLSVLDAVFEGDSTDFYHYYQLVKVGDPEGIIDGLQLVFIELPMLKTGGQIAPLKRAWLRFLRETGDTDTVEEAGVLNAEVASQAPEIREALELSTEAGFSRQLAVGTSCSKELFKAIQKGLPPWPKTDRLSMKSPRSLCPKVLPSPSRTLPASSACRP